MNVCDGSSPCMLGLGTALPPYSSTQERVLEFMLRVLDASEAPLADRRVADLTRRIYRGSGVERRQSIIPDFDREDPADFEFFPRDAALEPFPTTARRMQVYEVESVGLAERAAREALRDAGIEPGAVTHLIVCTCTGFFAPGPDVLLVERLGLRRDTQRNVVGFMGCYAGFTGLRQAAHIVASDPDAMVLVVAVELCSLHFQKRPDTDLIVANALFADGAGAAVLGSAEQRGPARALLRGAHAAFAPGSLDQMTWRIGDHGFEMRLAAEVPSTLRGAAQSFVAELLRRARTPESDIAHWVAHPGGPRILAAIEEALGLERRALELSYGVLRDHGNMSSATIFFVLERELARGAAGSSVALGFGPGLTMEGVVLAAE